MKLQEGKRYIRRNGEISRPLKFVSDCLGYSWDDGQFTYMDDGRVFRFSMSDYDLVAEYEEPEKGTQPKSGFSGLTLKQAIESGRPFKRPGWTQFFRIEELDLSFHGPAAYDLDKDDLTAEDYSLQGEEEEVVTLTKQQFLQWYVPTGGFSDVTLDKIWVKLKTFGTVTKQEISKK